MKIIFMMKLFKKNHMNSEQFRGITTGFKLATYGLAICILLQVTAGTAAAQQQVRGIIGRKAPSWQVTEWIQLPQGTKSLDVADFSNKIIYLFCFQSWCPGCHSHGFPTLKRMIDIYQDNNEVVFVAIQTTFEGFYTNNFSKLREVSGQFGLSIPFGQSGKDGKRSPLMRAYHTGGTPWTIIIDKRGILRFNGFHITPEQASRLIDGLK